MSFARLRVKVCPQNYIFLSEAKARAVLAARTATGDVVDNSNSMSWQDCTLGDDLPSDVYQTLIALVHHFENLFATNVRAPAAMLADVPLL